MWRFTAVFCLYVIVMFVFLFLDCWVDKISHLKSITLCSKIHFHFVASSEKQCSVFFLQRTKLQIALVNPSLTLSARALNCCAGVWKCFAVRQGELCTSLFWIDNLVSLSDNALQCSITKKGRYVPFTSLTPLSLIGNGQLFSLLLFSPSLMNTNISL